MQINVHKAKTHSSRLLDRVAAGEEIVIAKAGVPVARLIAIEPNPHRQKLGLYGDSIKIADNFDAPLPDEILAGFLGMKS
jgi:prevent-host-death family protein